MKAHVMGVPTALECECGEKFIIARWDKPPLQPYYDINFMVLPAEIKYCPMCGGQGGVRAKELA